MNSQKKYMWAVFAFLLPLYLLFTFDHSLWNPDETRDGGIARSMYVDHNFVVPQLNGEAFLEKPPLYYWSTSVVYAITRTISAGTTRLPAALYGFLGVLFTFLWGRKIRNDRTGYMAAAMLALSFQYYRVSHMALMDSALAALITGALYFYADKKNFFFLVFCVLAFYAKGFVALALIGVVVLWDCAAQRQWNKLIKITLWGIPVFLILVTPWVYYLWKAGGETYLKIFFVHNNFHRFTSPTADHTENPLYFYFLSFPADFLPWTLLFIPAIVPLFKKNTWTNLPEQEKLPIRFFTGIFIFLTISSSKRSLYLLPAFSAAALITALFIDKSIESSEQTKTFYWRAFQWIQGIMVASLIFLCVFVVQRMDEDKTFVPFVDNVKKTMATQHIDPTQIAGFDLNEMERGVFSFYLEHNFIPFKTREDLISNLNQLTEKPHLLMLNKNAREKISDILDKNFDVVLSYRPEEKRRSYILYQTKKGGLNYGG